MGPMIFLALTITTHQPGCIMGIWWTMWIFT